MSAASVENELLARRPSTGGLRADYTIAVEGQPKRHLKAIFGRPEQRGEHDVAFYAQCRQDDRKAAGRARRMLARAVRGQER